MDRPVLQIKSPFASTLGSVLVNPFAVANISFPMMIHYSHMTRILDAEIMKIQIWSGFYIGQKCWFEWQYQHFRFESKSVWGIKKEFSVSDLNCKFVWRHKKMLLMPLLLPLLLLPPNSLTSPFLRRWNLFQINCWFKREIQVCAHSNIGKRKFSV